MNIRPSPIAGRWYPGHPKRLLETVSQLLTAVKQEDFEGSVLGVLAPHAGFPYSGAVAAAAFRAASQAKPEIVVILSPFHRAHPAPLITTAHDAYETPLGPVPVAGEILDALNTALQMELGMGLTPIYHDGEHAIEIELPFLQYIFNEFQLIPLMMRDQRVETALGLGMVLADCLADRRVLFVASSDLSHFYPQREAAVLDKELLHRIAALDPASVIEAEQEGVGYACGRGAIATMLWTAQKRGACRVELLDYATSGQVSGDYQSVVGYGAAAVLTC